MVKEFKYEDIFVKIDLDKCTAIGECVDICPDDVYEIVDGKVTAHIEYCTECGACYEICPNDALIDHSAW